MNKKNLHDGFSLLELMVVIALTTLIVGLAVVNVKYLNKSTLKSEVDLLCATCRYLQQRAIASNETKSLVFDVENNRYQFDEQIHHLSPSLRFGVLPGVKGPPGAPHTALTKAITFKNNPIEFAPDGIINSGTVYVTNSQELYAISSSVAHTSYVRKYRFNNSWQPLN